MQKTKKDFQKEKDFGDNSKDNHLNKFELWWKKRKILVIIFIVFIVLSGIGTLIQSIYNIANFYKDVKNLYLSEQTIPMKGLYINVDSTELNCFLVFPDKSRFENWHKDVVFRLGLPKYPRNLATNEVDQKYLVKQYANWKKHPNSSDHRVLCGYNERLPKDLIDKNAELKYKFFKASYSDIEEMGFIKDKPNIVDQEIFNFNIPEIPELKKYTPPKIGRNWLTTPEYNFEFIMILFQREELLNKYLTDLGSIENKSRISVYLDREDFLCFRVIDENSKAYIIKLSHNLFDKKYQFNFKYGFHSDKSYMEIYINGMPIAIQHFNYKIPFYYYDNNMIFIGANLDGTYCCKLRMFKGNIYVTKNNRNIQLSSYDGHNLDAIYLSDGEIISYESIGEQFNIHRR